jgi:hypothetical protein
MGGLNFENVGWFVGGLAGGVGNGLAQGIKEGAGGAAVGAAAGAGTGAVVGLVTGPAEVVAVPAGAVAGAALGGAYKGIPAAFDGVKTGVPIGAEYGASAGKWLDQKIAQMTGADDNADKADDKGTPTCVGDCAKQKGKTRKNKDGKEIIPEDRAEHILSGDKSGGGHRSGTGSPGKTEFPQDWTDDDILDGVADVAENGKVLGPAHRPGEVVKGGTYNGVDIETVVKGDGGVRTGYPTGGPGVVRNPRKP